MRRTRSAQTSTEAISAFDPKESPPLTEEDDPIFRNPERVVEIAIRAFGRGKAAALAENDRLGVPSYGSTTTDGKITVRRPRKRRKLDQDIVPSRTK